MKQTILMVAVLISLLVLAAWKPKNHGEQLPGKHIVEIGTMKFEPFELTVNKGDTVVFINRDFVIHNVTQAQKKWASPNLSPKESWSRVFSETTAYYCSFHPMMKGRITVAKE